MEVDLSDLRFCEHANERPQICPCGPNCECRLGMCAASPCMCRECVLFARAEAQTLAERAARDTAHAADGTNPPDLSHPILIAAAEYRAACEKVQPAWQAAMAELAKSYDRRELVNKYIACVQAARDARERLIALVRGDLLEVGA